MSNLYNAVRDLSGQRNTISIQRPYVRMLGGDYNLAVVLSQLVFLSGLTSRDDGWFYKKYDELADEVSLSADQVRYAVNKLKKLIPDVLTTKVKKAHNVPTVHYHIDGDALIKKLFANYVQGFPSEGNIGNGNFTDSNSNNELGDETRNGKFTESKREDSQIEMGNLPNGNGKITESLDLGTVPESITDLHTDPDKQIKKTIGQPEADPRNTQINYQAVVDAYHELLPEMPRVKLLTDFRRKDIRKLWAKFELTEGKWNAYLRYISKHCRWMLEDRPDARSGHTWRRKNFDYLITEKCFLAVREERANDLPKPAAVSIDAEESFTRLVASRCKPRNEMERKAQEAAFSAGLGRLNQFAALASWRQIIRQVQQEVA